ncbi:hypothetical protein ACFQ14_08120 [Pseudahrensia aquimaris]|uniref:Uncharacterized protein n=1 Tax=Pseudahrensia aquimaris TaxID=744461 RepID=A0ABW3FFW2_9HYPH
MQPLSNSTTNPQVAARRMIEASRRTRARLASLLTLTLISASGVLLWINLGVLIA